MKLACRNWAIALALGLAALIGLPASGAAQGTAVIRGTVTDSASGQPISGAQVGVPGTSRGALTDNSGAYTIRLVQPGAVTVRAQRIGFGPSEHRVTVAAGDTVTVDFALHAVATTLSQVVVVGYGTQDRSQVTGAVTTVSSQDIANQPVAGVDAALQGKAPGVQVTQNSGDPGNGISVRVRGAASVTASNQPLYVIDGVPMQTQDFSQLGPNGQGLTGVTGLDPDEIESITVLKDAASAAIYGSRASNGVVMITTKHGASGRTRFSIDASTGWQNAARHLSLMNAKQYVEYMAEGAVHDGYDPADYGFLAGRDDQISSDWQDAVFRTAPISNVHLSMSGGTDRVSYFLGGSLFDQNGIVIGSSYKRASGLANIGFAASDRFSVKSSLSFSREDNHRIPGDNSLTGVVTNAIGEEPTFPIVRADGSFSGRDEGLNYANPVAIGTFNEIPTVTDRFMGSVEGKYNFTHALSFTGRAGTDVLNLREDEWDSPLVDRTYAQTANGVAKSGYHDSNRYLLEGFFGYSKQHENASSLDLVAGGSIEYNKSELNFVRGEGFSSDQLHYVRNATVITEYDGLADESNLMSYFGRANYSWQNKYLLSASLRADGSSRFGENNRWAVFPAISAGWVVSDEPFMGDFADHFGTLKLRGSFGMTGNQEIPNNAYQGTYTTGNYGNDPGIRPEQFANPNLKWESTKEWDAGLDWSPFDGRVSVVADYYHKATSNLLVLRPIAASSGFSSYYDNVGNVVNRGVELGVNTVNIVPGTKDGLSWRTDFNISFNHNEVTKLFENQPLGDASNFRDISRVAVGQPIGEFYVLHFTGVDPQTGDAMYQDVNGDGDITSDDRVFAGNPQPKWWGGLGNTVSWKGFSLRGFLEFSHGAKVFNLMRIFADDGGYNYDNKFTDALSRWQKPGDITNEPRASFDGNSGAREISDRFVEDGSYVRIQEVTLSWELPASLASLGRLQNTRLYVSGHNLHTFTKYSGYDPDVNSNGSTSNIALGTDYYAYPRARSFSIGVSTDW